jgi:hypothetical protein
MLWLWYKHLVLGWDLRDHVADLKEHDREVVLVRTESKVDVHSGYLSVANVRPVLITKLEDVVRLSVVSGEVTAIPCTRTYTAPKSLA